MTDKSFVLTTQCKDQPGISSALTTTIFDAGGNITEAQQFDDAVAGKFFSRTVFTIDSAKEARLNDLFKPC